MKRLIDHFWGIAGRMAPSQIVLLVGGAIVFIVGTVVVLNFAKSQYYAPLYSNLSADEAGKIVDKLNELNIAYEVSEGGKAISVPSGDVSRARMKLAGEGLPSARNIG